MVPLLLLPSVLLSSFFFASASREFSLKRATRGAGVHARTYTPGRVVNSRESRAFFRGTGGLIERKGFIHKSLRPIARLQKGEAGCSSFKPPRSRDNGIPRGLTTGSREKRDFLVDVPAINSAGFRLRGLNTGCTPSAGTRRFVKVRFKERHRRKRVLVVTRGTPFTVFDLN